MNYHLKSREIETITNLSNCLHDGLFLIYALENCTGQSIGKYNKRVMMDVQRTDNIELSLKFLILKNVKIGSISAKGFIFI
jgi:hypothetical protein